jgi:CHAT domain-containing protein/Tfp pilus assembly protein PilF
MCSFTLQTETVSSHEVIFRINRTCWARLVKPLAAGAVAFACAFSIFAVDDKFSEFSEGLSAYRRGLFDEAAAHFERCVEESRRADKKADQARQMIELASAYQALGQQTHAADILADALELAEKIGDRELLIRAKEKSGVALSMTRQNDRAEEVLREALEMARKDARTAQTAAVLNDLGTLLASQRKFDDAQAAFQESSGLTKQTNDKPLLATVLCNAAATAVISGNHHKAAELNGQAVEAIRSLAASHETALLLLSAAQTDQSIKPGSSQLLIRSQESARRALEIAEELNDRAMTSYALGRLGQLYQADKQLDAALSLTRRAAFSAQQAQSPDALYRSEWQAGRILKAQGKADEAIGSYRRAIETLQPIRHDIALGYGNAAQVSFRESLGPLFFELADLLLAQSEKEPARSQELLREARDTVEQLKAVELEDYFQDECVNIVRSKSESLEKVDAHSAVMYLIPLPTRTELLVGFTSGLQRFTANIGSDALISEVREFRQNLETRTTYAYLEQAQHLYDVIFRPIRQTLLDNKIDTIVFVPDGAFQTIPLAALHDGQKFLVQEFAVSITPGLSVVEPRPLERKKAQVLLSGLSDAVQGFPALDFVPSELETIKTEYQGEVLLNNSFVTAALERKLTEEQFSIVHIASHGQFDRDSQKTFVLTYDGKLNLNKLESLIRPSQYRGKPVELLVLSACQTAAGDDRAALGLAGVAVKAGARSALASLWFVNDQSTAAFVSELYNQLRKAPAISRAKAVQAAQLKMLADRRFRHPCYWAPYLLIGNWL